MFVDMYIGEVSRWQDQSVRKGYEGKNITLSLSWVWGVLCSLSWVSGVTCVVACIVAHNTIMCIHIRLFAGPVGGARRREVKSVLFCVV